MEFTRFETISIRNHAELNERWVQDRIAEDPSILGLGDIVLKDRERIQPRAGRLDLLLQDADSSRRYEVEIQLGPTDESHIIRTIEYWDIERKRYPQYEHTAVIIAEYITSRFLNVIGLFNGMIPLVAIQIKALRTGNQIGLIFTTVLDQLSLGLVDEDEGDQEITDRAWQVPVPYWRGGYPVEPFSDRGMAACVLSKEFPESLCFSLIPQCVAESPVFSTIPRRSAAGRECDPLNDWKIADCGRY